MLTLLLRQSGTALRVLLVATVALGLVYPLGVWAVTRVPGLSDHAEGSVVTAADGTPVGSALIGVDPVPADPAADPYFHTRPSASAQDVLGPGDPSVSGGSNEGGFDPDLLHAVGQRRDLVARREGVTPDRLPADAVTASASGVDPHISPAYAALQVPRVARVTGLPEAELTRLVDAATAGRPLGVFGDPGVNVTELNIAVLNAALLNAAVARAGSDG